MTQTYELANNPYFRQPENVTIVTIKKEHGQRYSYEQAGLAGDRTHESQEVLIQAVLDVIKAELDQQALSFKRKRSWTKQHINLLKPKPNRRQQTSS